MMRVAERKADSERAYDIEPEQKITTLLQDCSHAPQVFESQYIILSVELSK